MQFLIGGNFHCYSLPVRHRASKMAQRFAYVAQILNAQHFLCLFPYRFRYDSQTKAHTVESGHWICRVACAVVHTLILYESVHKTINFIANLEDEKLGNQLLAQWVVR